MPEARVENIEALKTLKRALWRFAEIGNAALGDAESDGAGTLRWLETEQRVYWQNAMRKSQELVSRCDEALRHKKIFKDASGRTPSAVDEEKALAKAKRMLEHATERAENVRRSIPKLQRELLLYKGQVQRLSTFLASEIPTVAAKLDKMTAALEAYVNLGATGSDSGTMNLPANTKETAGLPAPSTEDAPQMTEPSENP